MTTQTEKRFHCNFVYHCTFQIHNVCVLFSSQLPVAAPSGQAVTPAAAGGLVAAAATPAACTGTAASGVTQLPQLTIVQNQHGQQMLSVSVIGPLVNDHP